MKKLIIAIILASPLAAGTVLAQEQEGVKKEGAHEAEYNTDAQDYDQSGEIDSRVQDSEAGRESGDAGAQESSAADYANTAGTDTRTTSPSGSPALLTEGEEPDGTNTMQRASLNIAGSPLPGSKKQENPRPAEEVRSDNRKSDGNVQKNVPGTAGKKGAPANSSNRERKNNKKK